MDPGKASAGGVANVTRIERAARQQHRVVLGPQLPAGHVDADVAAGDKPHTFGGELLQPEVDVMFLQLEVGDAVAEQSADPVAALVQRDPVPSPGQLLRGGHAGRARADHGNRTAGRRARRQWHQPAVVDRPVDDLDLDLLDGDRVVGDAEYAGRLARRRAEPAGELGEVVGGVQGLTRVGPPVPVHQVVPGRDQVAQRAALVTERDAAVHAARGLLMDELVVGALGHLAPVAETDEDGPVRRRFPAVLQEAARVGHSAPRGRRWRGAASAR